MDAVIEDSCIKATESSGGGVKEVAKDQAVAPVIAGVVVTLIAVVTLLVVGAVTVAVFIVHKRSKKNKGGHCYANLHNMTHPSNSQMDWISVTIGPRKTQHMTKM